MNWKEIEYNAQISEKAIQSEGKKTAYRCEVMPVRIKPDT
jgi:hypothetical protein